MFLLANPDYYYCVNEMDTGPKKQIIARTLWKLESISAGDLQSMDCGSYMINLCYKPTEKFNTIIPGRKTSSGLTHFFKQDGEWKFMAEEDYAKNKDSLPGLSFAVLYPFNSFETKAMALPDLDDVLKKIGTEEEARSHGDLKGMPNQVSADSPLYCSVAKISGKNQRKYLTEDEALDPNNPWVMNPLILYRVKKPA